MARTGEQYGCSLELLPEEIVVSIFSHLPIQDLLACSAVCKRFAKVINTTFILIAKAFCKKFAQPPDPTLFGKDRYKQGLRPWLEAFVTAQQRLTGGASDDLQFSNSQVEQLDRLIEHREFPKALFFIQAKTLQNAESLYLQGEVSHFFFSDIVRTVCFSPDGSCLVIPFGNAIRFMVLDGNSNVVRQNDKRYNTPVEELRFSPEGDRLAILGYKATHQFILMMRSDEKGCRVQNFVIPCNRICTSICFSPDGRHLMLKSFSSPLQSVIGLDMANSRVYKYKPFRLNLGESTSAFSPNGSSLAIACDSTTWVMGLDKGRWVRQACIPNVSSEESVSPSPFTVEGSPFRCDPNSARGGSVKAVYFSPDSRRLAMISAHGSTACPNSQVSIYEIKTGAKVLTDRDNQFLKGFFSS